MKRISCLHIRINDFFLKYQNLRSPIKISAKYFLSLKIVLFLIKDVIGFFFGNSFLWKYLIYKINYLLQDNGREVPDITASPGRAPPVPNTRPAHPPPMVIQGDFRKVQPRKKFWAPRARNMCFVHEIKKSIKGT